MFDIGFFELTVVAVLGLVVIGPEKLPETIRAAALWWGRLKREMTDIKVSISEEVGIDQIQKQLQVETIAEKTSAAMKLDDNEDIKNVFSSIHLSMTEELSSTEALKEELSEENTSEIADIPVSKTVPTQDGVLVSH